MRSIYIVCLCIFISSCAAYTVPAGDIHRDDISDRLKPNPPRKPNILLIMADDLGYNDLAINNGNTSIDTPNMDQIARDGVRFTRHYASAVCSPARAALLTGIYPERLGYLPNGRGISPEVVTIPERLKEVGYTTWHIGKWHVGDLERTAWPDHQGFDHWFGFLNQSRLRDLRTADGELRLTFPTYVNPWLESDSAPGKTYPGHLDNILTDKAISVLSDLSSASAPWFLNLWYFAPHAPIQPASDFARKYPNTAAGRYQALVNQLDFNIGRVISHLDSMGALQNTIIVVVSDNGGTNLDGLDNNAPFYGFKGTLTEGGMRTPLIIKWPDQAMNGQVIADTVAIEDIYPTLLESIGFVLPDNLDGSSFYQNVRQRKSTAAKARYWDHLWPSYTALSADGRWRLYVTPPYFGPVKQYMFDLEQDPAATLPVSQIPSAQLTQMTRGYQAWYRDVHTVKTAYAPGVNGSAVLTGMDFLRTPGFGRYTFGIGISQKSDGRIAAQSGIWELRRTGNTVTAQFGDLILSGDIQNSNSCHSIVVSGLFSRKLTKDRDPETMSLVLYIDGIEAQTGEIQATLNAVDPTTATIIGDPATGGGIIAPPVILNIRLNSNSLWTPASFSEELCNTSSVPTLIE